MNRSCRHAFLAPLLAVVALLLGLTGSASAAFNHAATEPHYGNFLLWESEASGFSAYEIADPIKENGEWIYDSALGVPVYVRQNPWTKFDPLGLYQQMPAFLLHSNGIDTTSREYQDGARQGAAAGAVVAGTVAASMAPGVGEAMDAAVIADPKSTPFEKKMAGASLAVNGLTAGFLPNVGGILRAGRESAEMLAKNGDTVVKVSKEAVATGTQSARATKEASEEAVIYLRKDQGGGEYVGKAKSNQRYEKRQQEHADANPDSEFEFEELERVKPDSTRSVEVAEEDWIRAGGGPTNKSNPNGELHNKRHEMSDKRYRDAGGEIDE